MCDAYTVKGYEVLEKTVGKQGNSGHIYLPQSWVGATVKIVRTTPIEKVEGKPNYPEIPDSSPREADE